MRVTEPIAIALTGVATLVACGPSSKPELDGLSDQVAQVGQELHIDLNGTDSSGDRLAYAFRAPDLTDLQGNADITVSPDGAGLFRWTPLAADIGPHPFDFTVSNGSAKSTVTITITVKSALGDASRPRFVQPLGGGTTVDLSHQPCVDVDVVIEDQDTPTVTIAQENPVIDGATLMPTGGQSAKWHWCPTRDQENQIQYNLVLSADDGDNPKTIKDFEIVLHGISGACPGSGPSISSTPHDATTRLDLPVTAMISDALGLKHSALVYYSTTNPGSTPNLSMMTQVSATLASGDTKSGTWTASVPNPVATASAGTSATLYYVIGADDHDDTNNCDHVGQSPVYHIAVTAGGTSNAGLCQSCTADTQCGGNGNECVYMGSMSQSYCLQSCGGGCPSGYTCSASPVTSVGGASAVQCVPMSGSCQATTTCMDDSWEVNDSKADADSNPPITPMTYFLVSCPSTTSSTLANEDWYRIALTSDQRVDLQLMGDAVTDLDLYLYQADGTSVVDQSTSNTSNEEINTCLATGTYYVRIPGYGHARATYSLRYTQQAETCNTSCVDDSHEPDDTFSQARGTTLPFTSTGNMICPNNDDWYRITVQANQTVTIDLTFTQNSEAQDLDLHLYTGNLDLWPCSPSDPTTCSVAHGQGASSNEHATFTAPSNCSSSGCQYSVVVRGWNGASNNYDISIGVQ
jgi:hypothetical protein